MFKTAILTGGGDCPGINTVLRAVTKTIMANGGEVVGFLDGFAGLVENRYRVLDAPAISGLLHRGGTILGTNNRDNPFSYPVRENGAVVYKDMSAQAIANLKKADCSCLIVVGGDGSLSIAQEFSALGVAVIGVPKTIDNDLAATEKTFGFDTAVATATEALDRLHTTAESHHRVMVLELMGRYAGWIALYSGLAGGADVILIPEIPWSIGPVAAKILDRKAKGKPFSIVVVAEGALTPEGKRIVRKTIAESADPLRLGGIGDYVGDLIEKETGIETRVTVLGHIQRGGSPSSSDRILATRYGVAAAELALKGDFGKMVSLQKGEITAVKLEEATHQNRLIAPDEPLLQTARQIGITFGDIYPAKI